MTKYLTWKYLAITAIHFILWNWEIYIFLSVILKQFKSCFSPSRICPRIMRGTDKILRKQEYANELAKAFFKARLT